MKQSVLDPLAARLATHLDCTDIACLPIMRAMIETGQPLTLVQLARHLQMSQENLLDHLAGVPDTEFDAQGNIVGWGITLVPTQHQFRLEERSLFTWCAFDTVLFPPLLQLEASVQSACSASGEPIAFRVTPSGIEELTPTKSVLSLIPPGARGDCVRETFCYQSLFFQSTEKAASWMTLHPEAVLLSLEEAALLGQTVVKLWPYQSTAI